ncbi:hypothetical protein NMB32_15250 [Stenotrophomonas sp. CD2]|nr:hypothetical protein NMB32_15250 [Stenotrophomonas sp. CD2]
MPRSADGTVMTDSPYRTYRVGIGVSLVLAALIATLSLIAVATPNLGWGVVALATIAIWVGVPLLLVLLLAWLRYMVRQRGQVPGRIHVLMFVPTAASMLIIPLWHALQGSVDSRPAAHVHPSPSCTSTSAGTPCGWTPRRMHPPAPALARTCPCRATRPSASWPSTATPTHSPMQTGGSRMKMRA